MNVGEGLRLAVLQDANARPRPVLFLHIPKTAGTSFLLMLCNTFSDRRVLRIHPVDAYTQDLINVIVDAELDQISCLAGHFPIHLFQSCLDQFRPFTLLRNPIDRVLSLFRFYKLKDRGELQLLGFRSDFTLEEFLNSREPSIFDQVNNGMVRKLCGDPRLSDENSPKFWSKVCDLELLRHALANLERIEFGLTDQMPRTLRLVQESWSLPYALNEYRENTTEPDGSDQNMGDLHQIIKLNTMDLVLYERARTLFQERVEALPPATAGAGANPLAVFVPPLNVAVAVDNIPGRQGFYEFEAIGLSWLRADQTAGISFIGREQPARLRLRVYSVIDNYPIADVTVRVNQQAVRYDILRDDNHWVWLLTDYFDTRSGLNQLSIETPLSVPITTLDKHTKDKRKLGIALSHVTLETRRG
jgi:hypothetical protein